MMYPKGPLKTPLDPEMALGTGVNSHLKWDSSAGTEGVQVFTEYPRGSTVKGTTGPEH